MISTFAQLVDAAIRDGPKRVVVLFPHDVQRPSIVENAIAVAHRLNVAVPRVALWAAISLGALLA